MRLGIIGFGGRINGLVKLLLEIDQGSRIGAITDIHEDLVRKRLKDSNMDDTGISFYADADEMLDKEKLDGVMIGTRCSLHTKMAVKVLKKDLPLFLEKPVSTSMDDLLLLKDTFAGSKSEVVVSFPLRVTPIVQLAKEIVESGKIGTVEHVQAINNVPYGGVYYHDWYRDENETGGLFLQKATHDFDYINYLLGIRPVSICAVTSKRIFKGDNPKGLYCDDCDKKETCPEGPFIMKYYKNDLANGQMCCYAEDTGNEDSGSAIIRYETGMHASYSQNFFARKAAAARGARMLGYKGSLEFDWFTEELKVCMYSSPRVDTYKFEAAQMNHGGGDFVLMYNYINVVRGKEKSTAPLEAGLLSCLMCLKAKKSAKTDTFQTICWE